MCPTWTEPSMHLNHCDTTLVQLFKTEIFMIIFSALFSGFSPFPLPKRPTSTFSFLFFFIFFLKSPILIQFNHRNTKEGGARPCFDHVATLARPPMANSGAMMSPPAKMLAAGDDQPDRLSNLPKEILYYIMDRMPISDAARTKHVVEILEIHLDVAPKSGVQSILVREDHEKKKIRT